MATRSMQSDSWANAAANLGEALFPSARTVAQGKIAGQTLSELAARTRKQQADAELQEGINTGRAKIASTPGIDSIAAAILGASDWNGQQGMEALKTRQAMVGNQSAADAFTAGDYTGAGAGRLAAGLEPLKPNEIDEGYQINPYVAGGEMTATTETLADILSKQAQADSYEAAAGYNRERTANPERFRAPGRGEAGGKPPEVTTAETNALANEIARFVPKDTDPVDIMAATEAASRRLLAGETPAAAIQGGVADVFEVVPEHVTGDNDWIPFNEETVPETRKRKKGAAPAAPAPAAASRTVVRTGTLNGRRVVQYSDGTVDYAP